MAKKLSFDNLPAAVEKMLEILTSEGSEHVALPELVQRVAMLEKKIDYLQKTVSPDKPVMDMPMVCKCLKMRPKAINELVQAGVLLAHNEGRKTLFYEYDVVKFFMTTPAWKATAAQSLSATSAVEDPAQEEIAAEGRQRVGVGGASVLLNRSKPAIYQLISNNKIPYHKEGSKVYFFTDELREWAKSNRPRKRRSKMMMM